LSDSDKLIRKKYNESLDKALWGRVLLSSILIGLNELCGFKYIIAVVLKFCDFIPVDNIGSKIGIKMLAKELKRFI
jgi:hypothetical protein